MRLRIFTEPQQGASYATLRRVAQAAERLGFDAFFRSDHYLDMGHGSGLPGPTDAWTTLAALAVETSRIRLGTLMSPVTFRLPGPLAIAVAQADQMSGGRVELGLGTGWFDAEHAAYGIPFPPLAERFGQLEEQLAIITGLWTTPEKETFSFRGSHYQVTDSPALPKPAQRPRPPVLIGGAGPRRTPRLAAAYADEYNVAFSGVQDTAAAFGRVREACAAAGRDAASMRYSVAQTVCCGRDAAELERRAAAIGQPLGQLRAHGVAGTPAEVTDRIGAVRRDRGGRDLPAGSRPGRHRPAGADRGRGTAAGNVRLAGEQARRRLGEARVARLATVGGGGRPHIVPVTFALAGDRIYSAVDAKPKTTRDLRRLRNIRDCPQVAVLADHYEEDWSLLWWVRADGRASILAVPDEMAGPVRLLAGRYPQYRSSPPAGPVICVQVEHWSGWAAAAG